MNQLATSLPVSASSLASWGHDVTDSDLQHETDRGYRAKLIHPDGTIETTLAIAAATLSDVMRQVEGLTGTYSVEIWLGGQLVQKLPYRSR